MPVTGDISNIPEDQRMLMPSGGGEGAPLDGPQIVLISQEAYRQAGANSIGIDEAFQMAVNTFRRTHKIDDGQWVQRDDASEMCQPATTIDYSESREKATIKSGALTIKTRVKKNAVPED